jgi:LytS/YehU family sensor histidine kinase
LALQCLVENSVKHVVAQRPQGGEIHVTATRDENLARLEVIDDGPGFSLESITPEHGLGNLVGRLELLFGDRARLTVSRQDGMTVVGLTFPIE